MIKKKQSPTKRKLLNKLFLASDTKNTNRKVSPQSKSASKLISQRTISSEPRC